MRVFDCIHETIATFEREGLAKPCEIALDARVYELLEAEVLERPLRELESAHVAFAPAPSITVLGVRVVRVQALWPERWSLEALQAAVRRGSSGSDGGIAGT